MASVVTTPEPRSRTRTQSPAVADGHGAGNGGTPARGGDGGGPHGSNSAAAVERYKLGVKVGSGGIVMVFAAFTSAVAEHGGSAAEQYFDRKSETGHAGWLGSRLATLAECDRDTRCGLLGDSACRMAAA